MPRPYFSSDGRQSKLAQKGQLGEDRPLFRINGTRDSETLEPEPGSLRRFADYTSK